MSLKVGFVGLGSMGGGMVGHFLDEGHEVRVYDVNEAVVQRFVERGALAASSPAELASLNDTVIASLPTPEIVREVTLGDNGLIHGAQIQSFIDMSTTGVATAVEVDRVLRERGVSAVDAPVAGGPSAAAEGTMAIFAAGPPDAFAHAELYLSVLGTTLIHVGPEVGHGQVFKLINNMLVATNYAAACEGLLLGAKAGLDVDTLVTMLNARSARSWASEVLLAKHGVTRTFDFGFRLDLMNKDLRLLSEFAEGTGVPLFTNRAARELWAQATSTLDPKADYTTLLKLLEQWSQTVSDARTPRSSLARGGGPGRQAYFADHPPHLDQEDGHVADE